MIDWYALIYIAALVLWLALFTAEDRPSPQSSQLYRRSSAALRAPLPPGRQLPAPAPSVPDPDPNE